MRPRTPSSNPVIDYTRKAKLRRPQPPPSWYLSSWRGLRSSAPTPESFGLSNPETTPTQFQPPPRGGRPSFPDHSRSAVAGHASYSSRASGTITFSDSCMSIASHFAFAYRVAYPAVGRDSCRSPGVTRDFRIVPSANTLVRWVNEKRLRPHSAGSTLPHLWPTCSSSGLPPLIAARYFSSFGFASLRTPCPPGYSEQLAPSPPWPCPAFAFVPA